MTSIRDKLRRLHRPRPTDAPCPEASRVAADGLSNDGDAAAAPQPRVVSSSPVESRTESVSEPPSAPASGPVEPVRGDDAGRASTMRSRLGRFAGLTDAGVSRPPSALDEVLFGAAAAANPAEDRLVRDGSPESVDASESPNTAMASRAASAPSPARPRSSSPPVCRPNQDASASASADRPASPHSGRRRPGRLAPELFSRTRFEAWRQRRVEGHLTMVPADRDPHDDARKPARGADAPAGRVERTRANASSPEPPAQLADTAPVASHILEVPTVRCTHLSEITRGRFHRGADGGTCWVARDRVSLADRYGDVHLRDALEVHAEHVVRASGDVSMGRFDVRDAVFFDLETSGLSAAKGAVAWIIGFAFLRGDEVIIEQIAMHDPAEEPATLDAALARIRSAGTLVSFNGASFDVRFLRHRLLHHGLPDTVLDRPHLDLLPTARRVWARGVTNHRLATLDEKILGRPRGDDIPGAEAPRRWATYLRDGDVRPLVPLFEHNRLDLVGLVALLIAAATGRAPHGQSADRDEVSSRSHGVAADVAPTRSASTSWASAQLRLAEGDDAAAEPDIRAALAAGLAGGARRRALADLATLRERAGDSIDAVRFWQQLVDAGAPDATPHIQLARIWRDGLGRPDRALDHLRRAAALAPWDERLVARIRKLEREVAGGP